MREYLAKPKKLKLKRLISNGKSNVESKDIKLKSFSIDKIVKYTTKS